MENQVEEEKKSKKKKYLLLLLLLLLLLFKIIFWYNYFQKPDDIHGVKEENNKVVTNEIMQPANNTITNVNTSKPNNTTTNKLTNTTTNTINNSVNNTTNNVVDGNVTKPETPEQPQEPEQPEEPKVKEFKVTSNGQKITEELTIFDDTKYNDKAIIYPGISNTYKFEISNTLDLNVVCEVLFEEENIENLPIKFRLKENGKYIKGDENTFVPCNQLKFNKVVGSQEENKYELEWKWQEGENDNYYGDLNKDIKYEIKLTVNANEQTEE